MDPDEDGEKQEGAGRGSERFCVAAGSADCFFITLPTHQISNSWVLLNNRTIKVMTSRRRWCVQCCRYGWGMNSWRCGRSLTATRHTNDGNLYLNWGLDLDTCWGAHAEDQEPKTALILFLSGHQVYVYEAKGIWKLGELYCLLLVMPPPRKHYWRTPKHSEHSQMHIPTSTTISTSPEKQWLIFKSRAHQRQLHLLPVPWFLDIGSNLAFLCLLPSSVAFVTVHVNFNCSPSRAGIN